MPMIEKISFLNHHWLWPVILTTLLIWLIFIWKERLKYPKVTFFVNISIALISLSALALIGLKPLKSDSGKPYNAVILTENYKVQQLDSLKGLYKTLEIIQYNSEETLFINKQIPERVFLLGDGIPDFDFWQLNGLKTSYLMGPEPKGIIKVTYKTHDIVGNKTHISGRYLNGTNHHKLLLETPSGNAVDSIILSDDTTQDFKLSADLNAPGNFVYQVTERDSTNVLISKYPVPIHVESDRKLKILILNEFPTFETKYLKNYLSNKGHQVLIRTQLTKDRFKYEYFNMTNRVSIDLNKKNLQFFDLMIVDGASYKALFKRKRSVIENAMREDGLGVFIQPNSDFFNSNTGLAGFNFQKDKNISTKIENWPRVDILTYPQIFKPERSLQTITGSRTKDVAAYKRLGLGRIGTSVIKNSYELVLNGHSEVYQHIWSSTLESLSKKEVQNGEWSKTSLFSFPNEPMDFTLRTTTDKPLIYADLRDNIPLQQDLHLNSLWKGRTYPIKEGWYKLHVQQDSSLVLNYYVADPSDWKSLRSYKTRKTNARYFDNDTSFKPRSEAPKKPINLLWLFIITIIGMGYLWLEPKL